MSKVIEIIETKGTCQQCKKVEIVRPYGPGNTAICFSCLQKDEDGCRARFQALVKDADIITWKLANGDEITAEHSR